MTTKTQKHRSFTLGVIGTGTMGSGIALLGLRANCDVLLYDISQDMLEKGSEYIKKHLERKNQSALYARLKLTTCMEEFSKCMAIIEAAPENFDLKKELYTKLDKICPGDTILASNTSTLPITAIAATTEHSERVGGMHFFNPAPVLPLVEIVRGARTSEATVKRMIELAERLGKTPVTTKDTPGFIVNRIARPFYGEALRLVSECIATYEQVDQIVEKAAGFRMGPFRLMDLIGIDINFAAMKSVYEQTFGDSRYQPSLLQLQKIQEKAFGKKTGRGFYEYSDVETTTGSSDRAQDAFTGSVYVSEGSWTPGLKELCTESDLRIDKQPNLTTSVVVISASRTENNREMLAQIESCILAETLIMCQAADTTVHEIATWMKNPARLVGFDGLFFCRAHLATLVASPVIDMAAKVKAEAFVQSLGKPPVWINDGPALVVPRIIAMLANEAAFAIGEELADSETIDKAMRLGVNYPLGPLEWAAQIGYERILAILDHLYSEYHEDRYRAAPYLRQHVRLQQINYKIAANIL